MYLPIFSALIARQVGGGTIELQPSHPFNKTDSTAVHTLEKTLVHPVGSDTIQNFSEIPSQSETSAIGRHSLWDGIRFLVFLILTLLTIAFMLMVGGFLSSVRSSFHSLRFLQALHVANVIGNGLPASSDGFSIMLSNS